jgi:hypothetical protein
MLIGVKNCNILEELERKLDPSVFSNFKPHNGLVSGFKPFIKLGNCS